MRVTWKLENHEIAFFLRGRKIAQYFVFQNRAVLSASTTVEEYMEVIRLIDRTKILRGDDGWPVLAGFLELL